MVEPRLRDKHEMPEVVAAAIGFAKALCLSQAKDALLSTLSRGLGPSASPSEAELSAQAFEALIELGGPSAKAALEKANGPAAPPGLRTLAKRAKERLAKGDYACADSPAARH